MRKGKTVVAALLSLGLVLNSGCSTSETIKNENGIEVIKMGPYIEISHEIGKDPNGTYMYFYSVYDRDTKIMYKITWCPRYSDDRLFSIVYDFDYDEEGHPVLKFYGEDK